MPVSSQTPLRARFSSGVWFGRVTSLAAVALVSLGLAGCGEKAALCPSSHHPR